MTAPDSREATDDDRQRTEDSDAARTHAENMAALSGDMRAFTGGRLVIDLDALVENWRDLAEQAAPAECSAVVKGDAYGIGLDAAVRALTAAGCRTFFVALVSEGLAARSASPDADIFVLNGLPAGAAPVFAAARLSPVLGSQAEIAEWVDYRRSRGGDTPPAALHIDTGMNRLGISLGEVAALAANGTLPGRAGIELVISHLACADVPDHPMNRSQLKSFRAARALLPGVRVSLANSAATLTDRGYHFDLVRPGIALYGGGALTGYENPMRPVVTLEARIVQMRSVKAGETVGYGAAETTTRDARIAIVSVGYADGFPRSAGGRDGDPGALGSLGGIAVPLFGRVSMDLMAFDVTDVPSEFTRRGSHIELFGHHASLDAVAARAGTIPYEILTHLGRRYARRYIGAGRPR